MGRNKEENNKTRFEFTVPFSFRENEFTITITSICPVTGQKHPDLTIKAFLIQQAEGIAKKKICKNCNQKVL